MTTDKDLEKIIERVARLEAMDGEKIYQLSEKVAKIEGKIALILTLISVNTSLDILLISILLKGGI